jgi:hypothetical protein
MAINIGDVFKPGDTVQASSIYLVTHDPNHTQAHEVTCIYGKRFPTRLPAPALQAGESRSAYRDPRPL